MTKQFDVTLWHYSRYKLIVVPIALAASIGMAVIWVLVLHQAGGRWSLIVMGTSAFVACIYGTEYLTRRLARVLVTDKGMWVQYLSTNQGFMIEWNDVASYRESMLNGGRELRIWLRAGGQAALPVSYTYMDGYFEMVQAVKQAVADYNGHYTAAYSDTHSTAIKQRVAFFETKAGRIILVVTSLIPLVLLLLRCARQA